AAAAAAAAAAVTRAPGTGSEPRAPQSGLLPPPLGQSEASGKGGKMKSTEVDQGLFTDSYCRVCSAQLISESQRVAHYESRKHANKVRLYYMLHPVDGGCPAKKLRTDNNISPHSTVPHIIVIRSRRGGGGWEVGAVGFSPACPYLDPLLFPMKLVKGRAKGSVCSFDSTAACSSLNTQQELLHPDCCVDA
ncbi:hypothetical protein CRUP_012118, partial [Coryphaenoides rupestris]